MALPQQQRDYFQQEEPHLGNQYLEDSYLLALIHRKVPQDALKKFEPDLIRFGDRVAPGGDVLALGRACELNPPKLKSHNAFGRRIDQIEIHPAWTTLTKEIAAEEGIIAIGYERKHGEYTRLYQMLKVYLFAPSSAVADCPLSMADGGARLIELNLKHVKNEEHRKKLGEALKHITSRDAKQLWTSGQWMTEKSGGSDVRGSETLATHDPKTDMYYLTGYKYFTSATNSEMAFTIGRTAADKNLSCFYLETRNKSGELNNIVVHKLKEKFGTRAVPTAELELRGTPAILVGPQGEGVKVISSILNITRIHNAVSSVSGARRALAIARDYSARRKVLGRLLSDNPLHVATLAEMELEFRAILSMLVDVLLKFGKEEHLDTLGKTDEKVSIMLRILTPLLKLYAGKAAIRICSEAIECLGGTGFMEDSHLPVLLRDMQVTSIWEGTTNVLSHDVWRPILKQNALPMFIAETKDLMSKATTNPKLSSSVEQVNKVLNSIKEFAIKASKDEVLLETSARDFAMSMSRTYAAALFLEHADATGLQGDVYAANRFVARGLFSVIIEPNKYEKDRLLGMDVDEATKTMRGVGDSFAGRLRARY